MSLTVVTIVEPRLLVVVTGTPTAVLLVASPVAVELSAPVELPPAGGKAVAVVMNVVPRESVVVMAIPPGTNPPIVEVTLLPAESVPVATRTLAVLTGSPVFVIVVADASLLVADASLLVTDASLLVTDASLFILVARAVRAVTVAVLTMLPAETWASASVDTVSQP